MALPLVGFEKFFNGAIRNRWPEHLEKMYTFWQTVLLGEHTYCGNPFMPHADLPVEEQHFHRWTELFHQTLKERFEGGKADGAQWRAAKMAEMFQYRIAHYRNPGSRPLI